MANTKKRKQKQTLKEFQAWLQGVEELQPEGWSPDATQWQLIRARIDGIIVEKTVVEKAAKPAPVSANPVYQTPRATMNAPVIPSGIPVEAADAAMTPAAQRMLSPGAGVNAKTPDIDTSDGNIESSFG